MPRKSRITKAEVLAFEADFRKRFYPLAAKLKKVEDDIYNLMIQSMANAKMSTAYWNAQSVKLNALYKEMNILFSDWSKIHIVARYKRSLKLIDKRIRAAEAIIEVGRKGVTELLATSASTQIMFGLYNSAVESFLSSSLAGRRALKNLFIATQQTLINESFVNIAVATGFEMGDLRQAKTLLKTMFESPEWTRVSNKYFVQAGSKRFTAHYYAEIVARTKFHQAHSQATLMQAYNYGTDLVEISSHNTTTKICYGKNTEVYTNEGWKLISTIKGNEKILSLMPENQNIEWVDIKQTIQSEAKRLINFKGKYLNINVTENHQMFFQNDYRSRYKKNSYELISADKIYNYKSGRFYAGCNWTGNRAGLDYCEFMGYYLSEGNVYKEGENNYRITISQDKKKNPANYKKIKDCCKRYLKWINIRNRNDIGIAFNSTKLGIYLKQFGKSFEKYIPEEIMNADKDCIRTFLDAYCLGDGNILKSKIKWNDDDKLYESKTYVTSSKRIADQLTELILKINKRPTTYIINTKGRYCKHKNGIYKTNHDTYVIREARNVYIRLKKLSKSYIDYNDKVYCLELTKNHIMYVRANGKPIWCGNCIPFEGNIYSVSGKHPVFPPMTDVPPFHPNCLHLMYPTFESGLIAQGVLTEAGALVA
jgi:hypothetical protein